MEFRNVFLTKKSIINNFKKHQSRNFQLLSKFCKKSKFKNNIYYLNKDDFLKCKTISFDYAILEKSKEINAIKLNIPWSDLGSWKEICKVYDKLRLSIKKRKIFFTDLGVDIQIYTTAKIFNKRAIC